MNEKQVDAFALCLFDSGSTVTLLNERVLPPGIKPKVGQEQSFTTTQGTYSAQNYVLAKDVFVPEFCNSRSIPTLTMRLFNSPNSRYDVIVGRDVLTLGFVLDHAKKNVTWDGLTIPMVRTSTQPISVCSSFQCTHTAQTIYTAEKARILDAKYDRTSARDVAHQCTHLTGHDQTKIYHLLNQFPNLFSGKLGRYVRQNFSIKLKDPSVQPIFCNPYPIPLLHQPVFQKELQHLIDEKVLKRIDRSEWAFPTFLIPKKDGRVRWISDFRKLNKLLRRPRYFLPSIPFIMQKRVGFTYVTKIDISMGFYTFELDEAAQKLCVISTPFGLYKYLRLPMGLTNSPDVFQSVMHPLFQDMLSVDVFIDDIGVFTNSSLEDH